MKISKRKTRSKTLEINNRIFYITVTEIPFREGVELQVEVNGEIVRVSDRQLGENEAMRIIEGLIKERL